MASGNANVDQLYAEALISISPGTARLDQLYLEALVQQGHVPANVDQMFLEALVSLPPGNADLTQLYLEALARVTTKTQEADDTDEQWFGIYPEPD